MNENFIEKLQTEHFLIGSFDAFLDTTKELIKDNSNLINDEVEAILKSMPTTYRAAITNKQGKYVGYIGLYNVDFKNSVSSLRLEVKEDLTEDEKNEILTEFKKYLYDSINITGIDELLYKTKNTQDIEKREIKISSNIVIPSKLLVPGISSQTLEKFSEDYVIPKLQMPFTIKNNDRVIGIIGLSNLSYPNKRANLNIFFDKTLGSDITNELSSYIIDDYIDYVHKSNIHNVTMSVNASNQSMLDILNDTNMNYYGEIPFSALNGDNVESNLMFQHIPNMKKENGIILPEKVSLPLSVFDTEKKELDPKIELSGGFKLVSSKAFEELNIDSNKIMSDHIKAMQNREDFTIPLGEDKYILQKGNGNYGISKALMNYSYVILDHNNNYCGYVNILRTNADHKNAEIEIAIDPKLQHRGLGTMVINRFYDELFSIGYASVTSSVFEFNKPSLGLHEKVAQLNGIRLDSYYINGKLWNMNIYSKINDSAYEEQQSMKR